MTLHRDLCSATVNGRVLFTNARAPQTLANQEGDFLLGVAGATQLSEGVIRIGSLQIRKLRPSPSDQ